MRSVRSAVVVWLALAGGASAQSSMEEEAALTRAGVRTDAEGLREFFRSRTGTPEEEKQIKALIAGLVSKNAGTRWDSFGGLRKRGWRAEPLLREAAEGEEPKIQAEAKRMLAWLGKPEANRIATMARLIRERKTPGALRTLLDYLPWLTDATIEEELFDTIIAIGIVDGRAESAVVEAVTSKNARQRAAAALVLGRSRLVADRKRAYDLQNDKSVEVRLRAGEGLLFGGDRRGVDLLIGLLVDTPLELAERAERLLAVASRRAAPSFMLSVNEDARKECQKAWRGWAANLGAKLDLKGLEPPPRKQGYRMVLTITGDGGEGAIREYTPGRELSWYTNKVVHPVDAYVLPDGNVLVAEYNACRVSLRDRKGKMLWARARLETFPHDAQLLPNGNVLIVTKDGFQEETPDRKAVSKLGPPARGEKVYSGQKLPGGSYLMALASGRVVELGEKNEVKNEFRINRPIGLLTIEALPGGRYLIPDTTANRVVIVDGKGKVLRRYRATEPTSAAMLPNGNVLVGSYRANEVVEIDCRGEVVWREKMPGQVTRVRVR